ncbi:MAG TPA: YdeI/OmpD-associated family protein [Gemmatimonadota bacterium]|nr:YdeI/OmpD-associated family protein [Gemmatimonadota bacterium]
MTGHRDPRVDAYIERSAEFARPILTRLREIVHAACPEAKETIKWGAPYFDHRGPLCGMAAFKRHCAFVFWKDTLVVENPSDEAMGQLGRIESLSDLPPKKTLMAWLKKAARLNEEGVKAPRSVRPPKPPVKVPADLERALKKNGRARAAFEAFSPSHRREYVEWIEEARREETRGKRLAKAIEWMAEGKPRHWKYQ